MKLYLNALLWDVKWEPLWKKWGLMASSLGSVGSGVGYIFKFSDFCELRFKRLYTSTIKDLHEKIFHFVMF